MIPFSKRFPKVGPRETRLLCFVDDGVFPRGKYGFHESYCEEEGCDCRQVLLTVIEESSPGKIWASISFGWRALELFTKAELDARGATPSGAFLDPHYPQSEHADEFLDLFESVLARDPAYVERLKRHYAMFKASPSPWTHSWQAPHSAARASRPKPEVLKKRKKL